MKIKKKIKKILKAYAPGGDLTEANNNLDLTKLPYAQLAQPLAGITQALSVDKEGRQKSGLAGLSGALSGAGIGAQLGSFAGPIGTGVGAAIGAVGSGLMSLLSANKRNAELNTQEKEKAAFEKEMRIDRDNATLAAFPTKGLVGVDYYANGGTIPSVDPNALKLITGVLESQGLGNLAKAALKKKEVTPKKEETMSLDDLFAAEDAKVDLSPLTDLLTEGSKKISSPSYVASLVNKARRALGTPSVDAPTGDELESVLYGEEDPRRYLELVKQERYAKYNNNPPEDFTENYLKVAESGHPLWNELKKTKGAEFAKGIMEDRAKKAEAKDTADKIKLALTFAYNPSVYGERTSIDDAIDINTVEKMKEIFKNAKDKNANIKFPYTDFAANFAMGGTLPKYVEGGQMEQLADGVQQAEGATHEEGGITVPDASGQPLAEIEDKEVVKDGRYVFSNRIPLSGTNKTFAQAAEEIADTPMYKKLKKVRIEAEEVLAQPTKGFQYKNTATRNLEKNPDPLDMLFQLQEQLKAMQAQQAQQAMAGEQPAMNQPPPNSAMPESGIPIAAAGLDLGKLTKGIGAAAPYLDNLTNAILTMKTPVIPTPEYTKAPQLNTTMNIGASLADMNRQAEARNKNLLGNVNQSNIARANVLAGSVNDLYGKNQLYQQKENTETGLKNQQVMQEYQNRVSNAQKLDQFNLNKMMRVDDIHSRISANVSDASENIQLQTAEARKETLDKQKLALLMMQYRDTGVLERSGFDEVMKVIESGGSISEAMAKLEEFKNPKAAKTAGGLGTLSSLSPTLYKNTKSTFDILNNYSPYRKK